MATPFLTIAIVWTNNSDWVRIRIVKKESLIANWQEKTYICLFK
jgi:hypothetical protein